MLTKLYSYFKKLFGYHYYASSDANFYLDSVLRNDVESIILFDRQYNVIAFNKKIEESVKRIRNKQLHVGDSVLQIIAESNLSKFKLEVEKCLNGQTITSERNIFDKNGKEFWYLYQYNPILKGKEIIGVSMISIDVTENKLFSNIIHSNENKYKALIDQSHSALFLSKPDGIIIEANLSACEMFGYSIEEFHGMHRNKIIEHNDPNFSNLLKERQLNGSIKGKLIGIKRNGDRFPIEVISVIYKDELSSELRSSTVITDITDNDKTEIELIKSKNNLEKALNELNHQKFALDQHSIVAVTDEKGTITYVNDKFCEISGYSREELIGKNHRLINSGYHEKDFFRDLYKTIYAGKVWNGDICNKKKDGSLYWVRTTIVPFNDTESKVPTQFIAIRTDITYQKKSLQELQEVNERFEYVTKATFDAVWDWDLNSDVVFMGEGFYNLFGYVNSGKKRHYHEMIRFIHPDDYIDTVNSLQQSMNSNKLNWSAEYRFLKANGEYAYVQDKAIIIRDKNNHCIRVIGAIQDISKSKQEQMQLKLLESVITNSTDAILITEAEPVDSPGPRIIYVNDAFTRMTGYSKEEVIGKSPRLLQGPESDEKELRRLKIALKNWETCEIETINYKKNGEKYWVNFSVVPVADSTGWYTHWIAIERDVTSRKQSEEEKINLINELSSSNKELKQFSYITSHNLRAPVANLLGIFNILDTSEVKNELSLKLIDGLKTSTLKLNDTLNDLIKILVIKENTNLPIDQLSLNDVLSEVLLLINNQVQDSKAIIQSDFSELEHVQFNKSYLESIFINMITNSIRYSKENVFPIIKIKSRIVDSKAQLEFSDNGIGMDMEKVKHDIFGLYKRFHNHSESKGIGLYLVQSQVHAMGGAIHVDSKVGVGTTFTITFKKI